MNRFERAPRVTKEEESDIDAALSLILDAIARREHLGPGECIPVCGIEFDRPTLDRLALCGKKYLRQFGIHAMAIRNQILVEENR